MLVNFGWMKEAKPIRSLFKSYCYNCSSLVNWHLWRETEWFMFFGAKSFPFLWKNFAVCPSCEFVHHLPWREYFNLPDPAVQGRVARVIEDLQLSTKNEAQKRFLRAQRVDQETAQKA